MLEIKIDQEKINKAKCDFDFICIKDKKPLCTVERCLDKVCFLHSCFEGACNNKIYYGDSIICNCPVRIEIFNKYGI